MAEQTGISWTDATFNPWWGCERVSPACARCYAASLAARYGHGDTWGDAEHPFRFFGDAHWEQPLKWARSLPAKLGRRPRVFCASMADVFEERPELDEHRQRLFDLIFRTPELDWQILTKRPEFARDWLRSYYEEPVNGVFRLEGDENWSWRDGIGWGILPNVWIGVSVENTRWTWRVDVLRQIPAPVRFISAEPLLESLTKMGWIEDRGRGFRAPLDLDGIDWLIVGGESGSREARPMHPDWARKLRDAATDRGIAFHFKQWGSYAPRGFVSGKADSDSRHQVEVDGWWTFYYGLSPKAGGKILDGREWCEFPESATVLA